MLLLHLSKNAQGFGDIPRRSKKLYQAQFFKECQIPHQSQKWKNAGGKAVEPNFENYEEGGECGDKIETVNGSHWAQQEAGSSRFWSQPSPADVAWPNPGEGSPFGE